MSGCRRHKLACNRDKNALAVLFCFVFSKSVENCLPWFLLNKCLHISVSSKGIQASVRNFIYADLGLALSVAYWFSWTQNYANNRQKYTQKWPRNCHKYLCRTFNLLLSKEQILHEKNVTLVFKIDAFLLKLWFFSLCCSKLIPIPWTLALLILETKNTIDPKNARNLKFGPENGPIFGFSGPNIRNDDWQPWT